VVVSGVTVACIAGVPAGTMLGEVWSWRSAFWAVAVLSAAVLVPVWTMLGRRTQAEGGAPSGTVPPMRREWSVLTQRPVVLAVIAGALVNAATFAAFTYLGTLGPVAAGSTVDHTGRPATALWCGAAFTAAALGVVLPERNRREASRSSSDIAHRCPSRRGG
jgi:predicted MFS family arabinose efflux permease